MRNHDSAATGLLAGVAAFLIWGLAPLYFNLLDGIPAVEILAHRSIWSLVLAVGVLVLIGRLSDVSATLRDGKKMRILALSTLLIGSNWLVFIWAITNAHLLDASLGYYINPIVNVLLGVLILGERLRRLQWLAVVLAVIGIAHELWQFGRVPVVALLLALSFGFYGLVRKRAPVDSLTGLTIETLYMLLPALAYLLWSDSPSSNLLANDWRTNGLLLLAGPITLTPLLLFNIAARRLNLSTLGFLQYLGPTLMLLLATLVFHEPFGEGKVITFACVWSGLLLYTADALAQRRKMRQQKKALV
ncbi:EamA family transporter RarD [Microbulbifer thermotolerans]|uniref:Chloramphenical resistance permease RarD n=1 Tax=Microbulbifer thermotolerans TaxID=252514 RepID=A0A143HPH8_MICTH|nr:EamA family transporter RarD [Microbulbifer thermotolerans]AMX03619.1 chloramphenical resistance permease RarD [Microbulbifer thermotolerans]MCX2781016.1 EamA family transporter RarD [Microbulbifer thermotolerans]MCX2804589.1 EamA family transporter RarD [Microbulbifer thermotolerans]SFD00651.1 chloramphenicol-sensitive protein RarD [Microbulbifer thermotolerans]